MGLIFPTSFPFLSVLHSGHSLFCHNIVITTNSLYLGSKYIPIYNIHLFMPQHTIIFLIIIVLLTLLSNYPVYLNSIFGSWMLL